MTVSANQMEQFIDLRAKIHTAVEAVRRNGVVMPEASLLLINQIALKVVDESCKVFGNRPSGYEPTWEDVRLLLLATMRNAIALLEEPS